MNSPQHQEGSLVHEQQRPGIARLIDLLRARGNRLDHPRLALSHRYLLEQFVGIKVQVLAGHVGVVEIRAHETARLIGRGDTPGLGQGWQVQPLVVVCPGVVVVVGEKTGAAHVRRFHEKHQAIPVVTLIFAEGSERAAALVTLLIEQDHLHGRGAIITVVPGIDPLHDLTGIEGARGRSKQQARDGGHDKSQTKKASLHSSYSGRGSW